VAGVGTKLHDPAESDSVHRARPNIVIALGAAAEIAQGWLPLEQPVMVNVLGEIAGRRDASRMRMAAARCAVPARTCAVFFIIHADGSRDFFPLPAQRCDGTDFRDGSLLLFSVAPARAGPQPRTLKPRWSVPKASLAGASHLVAFKFRWWHSHSETICRTNRKPDQKGMVKTYQKLDLEELAQDG
jgi:hypothetical protein